jgi:hypothetical protein
MKKIFCSIFSRLQEKNNGKKKIKGIAFAD